MLLKPLLSALALTTALTFPGLASARLITLTTHLTQYAATQRFWRSMSPIPPGPVAAACGWSAAIQDTIAIVTPGPAFPGAILLR